MSNVLARAVRVGPVVLFGLAIAVVAHAQQPPGPPGDAVVTVNGLNVSVQWTPSMSGGLLSGYQLLVRKDGANFPGSPFNIPPTTTMVSGGPLPPGSYTIQALAWNGLGFTTSAIVSFVISLLTGLPPGVPIFPRSTVNGGSVTLEWDPPTIGGAPSDYELEVMQPGGGLLSFRSGGLRRLQYFGIAAGLYLARVRGLNPFGNGPFTNFILIAVGTSLLVGDLSAALLWNGLGDVNLHVEEPGGANVFVGNPVGPTGRLELGDADGFGPELYRILPGLIAFGTYKFFAACGIGTSAVTAYLVLRLAANTASEAAHVISSTICSGGPNSGVGYNLAQVTVPGGAVTPTSGTTP